MLANGSLLMFRGTDPAGHTVVLVLSRPVRRDPKDHKAQVTPAVLSLVYAIDPAHPDCSVCKRGHSDSDANLPGRSAGFAGPVLKSDTPWPMRCKRSMICKSRD